MIAAIESLVSNIFGAAALVGLLTGMWYVFYTIVRFSIAVAGVGSALAWDTMGVRLYAAFPSLAAHSENLALIANVAKFCLFLSAMSASIAVVARVASVKV